MDTEDAAGVKAALGQNERVFDRIQRRVQDGIRPSTLRCGHFDDVTIDEEVDDPSRRRFHHFLFSGLAAGMLGLRAHAAYSHTIADRRGRAVSYEVRDRFFGQIVNLDYNNQLFEAPASQPGLTVGERALHNSHHFASSRNFLALAGNLNSLELALGSSDNPDVRAFILQRLVADNNFLGNGTESSRHKDALSSIPLGHYSRTAGTGLINRSLDLICTATLNTMPSSEFSRFQALDTKTLRLYYDAIGVNIDSEVKDFLQLCVGGMRASVFSVIQSKWMDKMRLLDLTSRNLAADASLIRQAWFEEVYQVANGLYEVAEGETKDTLLRYVSEDFFYTICRIAFHAFAWDDETHLRKILSVYFQGDDTMNPSLAAARSAVLAKSAPNIQWIKMLLVATEYRFGKGGEEEKGLKYQWLETEFQKVKPANAVVARAAAELGRKFGHPYSRLVMKNLFSSWFSAPAVSNQMSYYDLIANVEKRK